MSWQSVLNQRQLRARIWSIYFWYASFSYPAHSKFAIHKFIRLTLLCNSDHWLSRFVAHQRTKIPVKMWITVLTVVPKEQTASKGTYARI